MPAIPIPQPTPIERAGWNTDYQGAPAAAANAVGSPPNALMQANEIANQQAQNNMRTAQAAGGVQDLQDKQRSMQLSMLSGILNEPDPEKQRDLIGKLVPLANKMNPSYQIDSTVGVPEIRALVQSQVSPTEQATLANSLQRAQMVNGLKAEVMSKDAMGNPVITNKMTGEVRYPNAQESAYYEASGQLPGGQESGQPAPQSTGIFPNMAQSKQPPPMMQNPVQQPPSDFGFTPQTINPKEYQSNLGVTKNWQQTDEANRPVIESINQEIANMRPNIDVVHGGSLWDRAGLSVGGVLGTGERPAADQLDAQGNNLALLASQLGSSKGGRGSVLQLKTLLASKPNSANYQENNTELANELQQRVGTLQNESALFNAYINANGNTGHTLDNNAYKLADALDKQFPLITKDPQTGKNIYNEDNANAWREAIPDAIANPNKYLSAKNEAQGKLQQPAQVLQSNQPQTPIKTPDDVGAALQSGKITEQQARQLWSSMGLK